MNVTLRQPLTKEQAVALARKHAATAPHTYCFGAGKDPTWQPHDWVVDAILDAANGVRL